MANNQDDAASLAARFINSTNRHIFLTGKAGTGKTTFLRSIVSQTYKNTIVAAPTGIAAINAGGVTLHSLFQLPFGTFIPASKLPEGEISIQLNTPDTLINGMQLHATKRKMLKELELLIIDEVSMLRADLLDAIDVMLRVIRRNKSQTFGGVQVLFIGDLFQLPPVVKQDEWAYLKEYYRDIYFFEAYALMDQPPVYIELDKIYRQSEDRFITLLNHFRDNQVTRSDIDLLNSRYNPDFQHSDADGFINLTTHNRKADTINREALSRLPGKTYGYDVKVDGDFGEYLYPVEARLELKEGAQVMFIKNDYSGEQRYFNGKIGWVTSLDKDEIRVGFEGSDKDIVVERYTWENKKYTLSRESGEIEEVVAGTFSHYPLKLAWAITVHKSQGLTFEKAIIDVSSAFAPGQIYVALSRLVSLDGLVLSARVPWSGPAQTESLRNFVQEREADPKPETVLPLEIRHFIRETALRAYNFGPFISHLHYLIETRDKKEKKAPKVQKDWVKVMEAEWQPVRETADKFRDQLKWLFKSKDPDYLVKVNTRLEAARGYFDPLLRDLMEKVRKQIGVVEKEKKNKTFHARLKEMERLIIKQKQAMDKTDELVRESLGESTDI